MRYLLSRASRAILTRIARAGTLCAFDFDGTLSPIVAHPGRARMRSRTRMLLGRLAALYPCVVVSGRARADLLDKLGDVRIARAIGNHGAETEHAGRRPGQLLGRWKTALRRELGSVPGLWIEDKGFSLAVHYRQSPIEAHARRRILAAARALVGAHVLGGKQVVNLTVEGAPRKGDALSVERARLGCTRLLYAGDDDNDEDAFALSGNVLAVRIGQKAHSHAAYYLRSQQEIDDLLDLLIDLRQIGNMKSASAESGENPSRRL